MSQEPTPVALYQCGKCGNIQHWWQDRYCIDCWSSDLDSIPASQEARLLSWATYHTDYRLDGMQVPYTIGFIELPEGPKLPCRLNGDVSSATYGQMVRVVQSNDPQLHDPDQGALFAVVIPPA